MFSRGEPTAPTRRTIEAATRALAAAEAALGPGVPLSEVAGTIAEMLAPVAPQGKAPYGHGIGMDNFEQPVLSVNSEVVAEANMVMAIHPALVVENRNFYIGDTYLVTETGAERLSQYPLDLVVV
jgi:Xaa-Pro dipeptidase